MSKHDGMARLYTDDGRLLAATPLSELHSPRPRPMPWHLLTPGVPCILYLWDGEHETSMIAVRQPSVQSLRTILPLAIAQGWTPLKVEIHHA